jgi:hypothetical protein
MRSSKDSLSCRIICCTLDMWLDAGPFARARFPSDLLKPRLQKKKGTGVVLRKRVKDVNCISLVEPLSLDEAYLGVP